MSEQPSSAGGACAPAKMPIELSSLLGRAALLRTESSHAYDELTAQCAAAVDPRDMVEWLMVRDYVDLTWEILRLRRMKRHIVNLGSSDAVYGITELITAEPDAENAGLRAQRRWNEGGAAREAVCREFARHDLDEETIHTEAFVQRLDDLERLERIVTQKESLRRAVLRDLELYRESSLWRRRRVAAKDIETIADKIALAPPPGRRPAPGQE